MDITKWSILKSYWLYFFAAKNREALYSQQKQDWELTVAQNTIFWLALICIRQAWREETKLIQRGISDGLRSLLWGWPALMTQAEKAMAPHSSTLAWKIPWAEEPGRLQSMGSWRVGHDWATSPSLFSFMLWGRTWQPTPLFLPGESQGWRSLVGCSLWGRTESNTTEAT